MEQRGVDRTTLADAFSASPRGPATRAEGEGAAPDTGPVTARVTKRERVDGGDAPVSSQSGVSGARAETLARPGSGLRCASACCGCHALPGEAWPGSPRAPAWPVS